jgi:serine/threonine-protein kinase RsbT
MIVLSENEYRIRSEGNLHVLVLRVKKQAEAAGSAEVIAAKISTIASELGRNIVKYADQGRINCKVVGEDKQKGFEIVATDEGPGIKDVDRAMNDRYSSGGTLGLGLPGTKRMADEFDIQSTVGKGTTVTALVWI